MLRVNKEAYDIFQTCWKKNNNDNNENGKDIIAENL